jgi:hypothetical protein
MDPALRSRDFGAFAAYFRFFRLKKRKKQICSFPDVTFASLPPFSFSHLGVLFGQLLIV